MSFDFDTAVAAPFRMQPGLRRLAPGARQLTPAGPGSRHQREKLAVLSAFPALSLLADPAFDAGPALQALARHAAAEHPQVLAWDGRTAQALGVRVDAGSGAVEQQAAGRFGLGDEVARCLCSLPAHWRLAGLLSLAFIEDLAIVDADSGCVPWLAVALPSHWAPETKVGRHFSDIHAPVADNALLLKAASALLQMVTGAERWERFVWTITSHPRLHAHPRHVDAARWQAHDPHGPPFDPARAWWRSERQTFIPLPDQRQAWFLIEIQVDPLIAVVDSPQRAARLHDALASMSPAVLDYRGLTSVHRPLLVWLQTLAADPAMRPGPGRPA